MDNRRSAKAKCSNMWKAILHYMSSNLLVFVCVSAVAVGLIIGMILNTIKPLVDEQELYMSFPIDVLTHMIKGMTIPVIIVCVMMGIGSFKGAPCKKIAVRSAVYFMSTTVISVIIGIVVTVFLVPEVSDMMPKPFFTAEAFMTLYRNMFPDSVMRAFVRHYHLDRIEVGPAFTNSSTPENATEYTIQGRFENGVDMLGMVFMSLFAGLAMNELKHSRVPRLLLCVLSEITFEFIKVIRCYLPLGILFMTIYRVIVIHNWWLGLELIKLFAAVVIGLFIHAAMFLPLLYLVFLKRNPFTFIRGVFPALWTAFLLSSSGATLSVTVQSCKKNNIHYMISSFMLPIGTSININGTALYQAAAAVFIARVNKVPLDINLLFTIGISASTFSFMGRGKPACGALMSLFILNAAELPMSDAWMLVLIEWIIDHPATAVNVLGDCIGVALVQELSLEDLRVPSLHQDRTRTEAHAAPRDEDPTVQSPQIYWSNLASTYSEKC